MSVRTGFAIVGTAVGAYFGNASLGYAIGSMVGGYVDPIQVKGPRLDDAQQQTSQDGIPIPIVYGAVRISGNIIASSKLVEHKKVDDGKGSGTETTSYTYTRTYAIGVCEGPIGAIRRIWRDGKLIFDQSPNSAESYVNRASTRQFLAHSDIYLGDETQTPNSALQAIFGEEAVPAFRGLAYVVVRDDDLTNRGGSIPAYEFEVVQTVTSSDTGEFMAAVFTEPRWFYIGAPGRRDPRNPAAKYRYGTQFFSDTFTTWYDTEAQALEAIGRGSELMGWTHDVIVEGVNGSGSATLIAPYGVLPEPQTDMSGTLGLSYSTDSFSNVQVDPLDISLLTPEMCVGGLYVPDLRNGPNKFGVGVVSNVPLPHTGTTISVGGHTYYLSKDVIVKVQVLPTCNLTPAEDWVPVPGTPGFYVDPAGGIHEVGECDPVTGSFKQLQLLTYVFSTQLVIDTVPLGPVLQVGSPTDTEAFWTASYENAVLMGVMEPGLLYGVDYPKTTSTACFCANAAVLEPEYPILAQIVSNLCYRKGLTASDIDVAELTDTVMGFTVATATNAADAINILAPAYQFDEAEWDGKIRFKKRGGPTVAALNEQDAFDSDSGRIVETRSQELELPRKLSLAYMDVDANYAVTTQMAERLSTSVASSGIDQVTIAVVMDADKAARTVDILLKDQWSSINGTLELSVGDEHSDIVPTDVLFLSYEDALFRCRAVEVENADGIVKLNLQQDTASAYSSVAVGVPPRPSEEGNPTIIGPTFLEVLNLPALRDQDDRPGLYLAACGPLGSWPGAQVAVSVDDGQTWTDMLVMRQASTMGQLTQVLPGWTEHIPDTIHDLQVQLTAGDFESVTIAQMDREANPLCVGEEVMQFETAELVSEGYFELDGTLYRGRKNTDCTAWPVGTRVVSLSNVYFMSLDRSLIGRTLQVRATSLGTDVQYGTIKSIDFTVPKSVQEWPATNVLSERATDESLSMTWSPRHRLGTTASPFPSTSFAGYRLVFTNGSASRVFDTSTASFTYSAADQVTDFGSAGPLSVTLYAMNSIIGPGEGLTVTV